MKCIYSVLEDGIVVSSVSISKDLIVVFEDNQEHSFSISLILSRIGVDKYSYVSAEDFFNSLSLFCCINKSSSSFFVGIALKAIAIFFNMLLGFFIIFSSLLQF